MSEPIDIEQIAGRRLFEAYAARMHAMMMQNSPEAFIAVAQADNAIRKAREDWDRMESLMLELDTSK